MGSYIMVYSWNDRQLEAGQLAAAGEAGWWQLEDTWDLTDGYAESPGKALESLQERSDQISSAFQ